MTARIRRDKETVGESSVMVTVTPFKGAKVKQKSEKMTVHRFVTEPAYVRVSAGVTKNTGDYESLRVDVAVTCPCYKEEVDDTVDRLSEYVADRLDREIAEYLGEE